MIGLLEVFGVAGTLVATVVWLAVAFLAPGREARAQSDGPLRVSGLGWRARAWLYAPLWVPAVLLGAAILPGIVGELLEHGDHCLEHAMIHHHLCLLHPPHTAGHMVTWLLPLAVLLPMGIAMTLFARRAWAEWRLTRWLVGLSRPSELGLDVRVLDQDEPLALTVGWRRPVILLSTGLLSRAADDTLAVVLAHERAHVARRDTVYALLDRLAASLLPRPVVEPLLANIALAREHACDHVAGRAVGSRVKVAQALAEIVRLRLASPAVGVSMASGSLESRVRLLLSEQPHQTRWPLLAVALFVALVLAGAGPVHSALEHAITFLVH